MSSCIDPASAHAADAAANSAIAAAQSRAGLWRAYAHAAHCTHGAITHRHTESASATSAAQHSCAPRQHSRPMAATASDSARHTTPAVYGLSLAPRMRPMVRSSIRSTSSAQVLGQSCGHTDATLFSDKSLSTHPAAIAEKNCHGRAPTRPPSARVSTRAKDSATDGKARHRGAIYTRKSRAPHVPSKQPVARNFL